MRVVEKVLQATSPASALTAASTAVVEGLSIYDTLMLDADLVGATGGPLDVILQRYAGALWRDWYRFPQLAAAAVAIHHTYCPAFNDARTTVGITTTPLIVDGMTVGGHPGDKLRFLFIAGTSTSAGGIQTVTLSCFRK